MTTKAYVSSADMMKAYDMIVRVLEESKMHREAEVAKALREDATDMGYVYHEPMFKKDSPELVRSYAEYEAWYAVWVCSGYSEELTEFVDIAHEELLYTKRDLTLFWCCKEPQHFGWYDRLLQGDTLLLPFDKEEAASFRKLISRMKKAHHNVVRPKGTKMFYIPGL